MSLIPYSSWDPFHWFDNDPWGRQSTANAVGPASDVDRAVLDFNRLLNQQVRVHMDENDKEFLISLSHPGMTKEDLKVQVTHGVLHIFGEKCKDEECKDEQGMVLKKKLNRSFHRQMVLPTDVDQTKIEAKEHEGVLTISLPKMSERRHLIQIQ